MFLYSTGLLQAHKLVLEALEHNEECARLIEEAFQILVTLRPADEEIPEFQKRIAETQRMGAIRQAILLLESLAGENVSDKIKSIDSGLWEAVLISRGTKGIAA